MNIYELMIAALPLGDDTPILLYAILGIAALGMVIASIVMSKKAKHDDDPNKTEQQ